MAGGVAPVAVTPTEQTVADAFARILGMHDLTADDDFFDLGGDSLQAVQAALRLQARFGVEIPLDSLEISAKVGEVAALIDRELAPRRPAGEAL